MNISQKILAQTVTQLCLAKEIENIVISPGSRNAPLTISFTGHPKFNCFSIVDERCAAFFALGMAQQLRQPVALVCTSGSALLNYYPAIAEAYYSDIPLVVLSADRPAHLIDIGDGQTIQQENAFGRHILYSANCKEGEAYTEFNENEINRALNASFEQQGPVHINLPFSEPLYNLSNGWDHKVSNKAIEVKAVDVSEEIKTFKPLWESAEKKMILVGVLPPDSIEQKMLDELANDPNLIVFTETTSNLHQPDFFPAIDQLISSLDDSELKAMQPDVLLTFGGMIVSKRIKAFLRKYPPQQHWHVDPKKAYDTFFNLTNHCESHPNIFLESLLSSTEVISGNYRDHWLKVKQHRLEKHDEYLAEIPYSDFTVFSTLFKSLPRPTHLQLANSATVRYAQLFDLHESFKVFCNRGTSGIDGSTSTAVGAAQIGTEPVTLITGDLSFFYDSNALWNDYIPPSFRVIIVNNSGGGIFRILSGAKKIEKFEKYFETSHTLNAKPLCELYGFEYESVKNEEELKFSLKLFFEASERPKVLEIFTPHEVNDQVLLSYFDYIK
ncbi:MAG: 2-succinyl-5-enolpyruvyl-6-hydroxy-3-cyclohexene-1-carboxylic-acid synthase [Flavobacteriaceae bacterium]|nr:2-succinyl-5-enolpyruvyl-6-hydroxy-3-cyclohexene-1-carboxylic-acid synthase [Flavobacteriaceae bacterium]